MAGWIKRGLVKVNGRALPGKTAMEGGETVEVDVPPPEPTRLVPQDLPLDIVHEDESLIVLDKPSGLTVHPGAGQRDGTLANALAFHMKDLPALGGGDRPGIVHRLDKETSGVIVVARTEAAQRALSDAFAARTVRKTYLACVHGHFDDATGEIDLPIGPLALRAHAHDGSHRGRARRLHELEGRAGAPPAHARALSSAHRADAPDPRAPRPRAAPHRRGSPLRPARSNRQRSGDRGLLLHAAKLAFPHPTSGEEVCFEAPLPQDFRTALDVLAQLEPPRRRR